MFETFGRYFIALWLLGSTAQAEFLCSSEVSYKWKRLNEKVAGHPGSAEGQAAAADAEKVYTVPWSKIEAKGADEVAAKAATGKNAAVQRKRAEEECRKERENMGGCLATKFASSANVLQGLGFSQRKTLEEAITTDCKASQGVCIEATASDPTCTEIVKVEETKEAAGGKEKEAKGAKKK